MRWGRVLWCDLGRLETCGDIAMLNVAGSKRERARVPSDVERPETADSVEKLQNALASNSCEGVPQLTTHAVSPARID